MVIEKEYRFYNLHPGRSWKKENWDNIVRVILSTGATFEREESSTTESYNIKGEYDVTHRHVVYRDGRELWEKKKMMTKFSLPEAFATYTVSSEEPSSPANIPSDSKPMIRRRNRHIYVGDKFRFDLTTVTTTSGETVEIEMEVLTETRQGEKYEMELKEYAIEFRRRLFQASDGVVKVNTALQYAFNRYKTTLYTTSEARPFSSKDFRHSVLFSDVKYFVAPKADGDRSFLHFKGNEVTAVTMTTYSAAREDTTEEAEMILECEFVDGIYYAYDIIYRNRSLLEETYEKRRSILTEYLPQRRYLKLKEAYLLTCCSDYFRFLPLCLREDYKKDGLIFTPNTTYHIRHNDPSSKFPLLVQMLPINKRSGSGIPDIMKWKPEVTVDLMYNNRTLYMKDNVEFTPSGGYLLNPGNYENGRVYEFSLVLPRTLHMLRLRDDKDHGNTVPVAYDNWNNMLNPLTTERLLGEDLFLLRKYHNYMKEIIFRDHVLDGRILDIGSGRGGDLEKYKLPYNNPTEGFVLSVEPNLDNLREAEERLKSTRDGPRVTFLNVGGEETREILSAAGAKNSFLTITLMLSASFFWKSPEMLQKLADTLRKNVAPGGRIIIFTVNGEALRTVREYKDLGVSYKVIDRPGNYEEVRTTYPDETIVGNQIEYCVYIDDLLPLLGDDFKLTPIPNVSTEDPFISPKQRKLNYFYSVHIIDHKDELLDEEDAQLPDDMCEGLYNYFPRDTLRMQVTPPQGKDRGKGYLPIPPGSDLYGLTMTSYKRNTLAAALLDGCYSRKYLNDETLYLQGEGIRRHLAEQMNRRYVHGLGGGTLTFWCFMSRGYYAERYLRELREKKVVHSFEAMKREMTSKKELREEHLQMLVDEIGIKVIVFEKIENTIVLRLVTRDTYSECILLLVANGTYALLNDVHEEEERYIFDLNDEDDPRCVYLSQYVVTERPEESGTIANRFVTLFRSLFGRYNAKSLPPMDKEMREYIDFCAPVINV